jgi:hypothetical protein
MGDTERFDDPKTGSQDAPSSSAKPLDDDERKLSFGEEDSPPESTSANQGRSLVRRSSLRPAPPSFRPSARDPALLRPVMVIHAGDAEPSAPRWDIAEAPPSRPSQAPLDSTNRVEPFALAEDLAAPVAEATLPLVIPPPGAVPRYTLDVGDERRRSIGYVAGAAPALAEPAKAAPFNLQQLSHRQIASVIAAFALVGVVVAMMLGRNRPTENRAAAEVAPTVARVDQAPRDAPPPTADDLSRPTEPRPRVAQNSVEPNASSQPRAAVTAAAPPKTTRVTLEVLPSDARVIYRGTAHPGPPFEFDVPKDKRLAVEVARSGFVTRKVIIDGKRPLLSIGLLRSPGPKSQR